MNLVLKRPELPINNAFHVILIASVFADQERQRFNLPVGTTMSEVLDIVLPKEIDKDSIRMQLGEHVIYREYWRAKPKAGQTIVIRVIPMKGARGFLSALVTIASLVVAPYLAPYLASFTGISLGVSQAVISASLAITGNLLINALIPIQQQEAQDTSPTYAISGWRNVENPDGTVPQLLGKHRMAPQKVASDWSEIVGDDQYAHSLLSWGGGNLNITYKKIGETPIEAFVGYQEQDIVGIMSPTNYSWIYPEQRVEKQMSVELRGGPDEPISRVTFQDITGFSYDISLPNGLGFQNDQGDTTTLVVQLNVHYRKVGDAFWTFFKTETISRATTRAVRVSSYCGVPERGTYEVELRNLMRYPDTTDYIWNMYWTVLRSHRPELPINYSKNQNFKAVMLKATGQLNGQIDEYNGIAALVCPDYDYETETWITRETSNPASLSRFVLQSEYSAEQYSDDEIDLDALVDLHNFCTVHNLKYNRVHDFSQSQWDVLRDIAAAGRAKPFDNGDKITWIIDKPKTVVIDSIGPKNSWDFEIEFQVPTLGYPAGYRVTFYDETNGWEKRERIIPWPGGGDLDVIEDLPLPGVTNPSQVFIAARRRQLEIIHRRAVYSCYQNWRSLNVMAGDLALLSHDVLDRNQIQARVKEISGDIIVIDEKVTIEDSVTYAIRCIRPDYTDIVRSVSTVSGEPGTTNTLKYVGSGTSLAVGDMISFGRTNQVTIEAVVRNIERQDDFEAKLYFLDHAPEIDEILDATEIPAWDGRVGDLTAPDETAPTKPLLGIVSGNAALGPGETGGPYVNVSLYPGTGNSVAIANYDLRHRLEGDTVWTTLTAIGPFESHISGYAKGADIEVQARARSVASVESDWSDIATHEVGSSDAPPIAIPGPGTSFSVVVDGADRDATWRNPNSPTFVAMRLWRAASGAPFADAVDVLGAIYGSPNVVILQTDSDALSAGDYDYWITSENVDGAKSSPVGPRTITVT